MAELKSNITDRAAPNFERRSRGVPAGPAPKGKTSALAGVGNLISQGVAVADNTVKGVIASDIEDRVTPLREQLQEDLKTASPDFQKATVEGGAPPKEVTDGVKRLDVLTKARDTGRLSSSSYWGRINAQAKQLKNRYPGHTDFINQQFAKTTGSDPQNALEASLNADIRAQEASASNKSRSYQRFKDTNIDFLPLNHLNMPENAVREVVLIRRQQKAETDSLARKLTKELKTLNLTKQKRLEKENTQTNNTRVVSSRLVTQAMTEFTTLVDPESPSLGAYIGSLVKQRNAGTLQPKEFSDFMLKFSGFRQSLKQNLLESYATEDNSFLTREQRNNLAEGAIAPIDAMFEAVSAKQDTVASYYANHTDRQTNADAAGALRNIKGLRQVVALSKVLPGNTVDKFMDLSGKVGGGLIFKKELGDSFVDYMSRDIVQVSNDPSQPDTLKPVGGYVLSKKFEDARKDGIDDPKFYKGLVTGMTTAITARGIPEEVKSRYLWSLFSIDNGNFLSTIKKFDMQFAFTNLLQDKVISEVVKRKESDPALWDNYQAWIKQSTLTIMKSEVQDLKDIVKNRKFIGLEYKKNSRKFATKPRDKVNVAATGTAGVTSSIAEIFLADTAEESVRRINSMIERLVVIAEKGGDDPDAFVNDIFKTIDLFAPLEGPAFGQTLSAIKSAISDAFGSVSEGIVGKDVTGT